MQKVGDAAGELCVGSEFRHGPQVGPLEFGCPFQSDFEEPRIQSFLDNLLGLMTVDANDRRSRCEVRVYRGFCLKPKLG